MDRFDIYIILYTSIHLLPKSHTYTIISYKSKRKSIQFVGLCLPIILVDT